MVMRQRPARAKVCRELANFDSATSRMIHADINRVAVAVPEYEVHGTFVHVAENLLRDRRWPKPALGKCVSAPCRLALLALPICTGLMNRLLAYPGWGLWSCDRLPLVR
jgi:hypothetical protein